MARSNPFVNPADQVAEIRVHANGAVILSHINYGHLKRVMTARSRRDAVNADAKRLGVFGLRFE